MSRKSKLAASSKAVDPTLAALFAESVRQEDLKLQERTTDTMTG
jgi:hypothetical protein